jgi:hypothetical protein
MGEKALEEQATSHIKKKSSRCLMVRVADRTTCRWSNARYQSIHMGDDENRVEHYELKQKQTDYL